MPQQAERNYYHLITRDDNGIWSPQFGDFNRDVVEQERLDTYLARYPNDELRWTSKNIKIVRGKNSSDWIKGYIRVLHHEENIKRAQGAML